MNMNMGHQGILVTNESVTKEQIIKLLNEIRDYYASEDKHHESGSDLQRKAHERAVVLTYVLDRIAAHVTNVRPIDGE